MHIPASRPRRGSRRKNCIEPSQIFFAEFDLDGSDVFF
jgi:hypothetical protein